MQDASSFYHDVTMDWDLDPGREGAGAGYFSFAPGYPSGLTYGASGINHYIVQSQFVNSLARLAAPQAPRQKNESVVVPACAFQADTTGSYTQTFNSLSRWAIPDNDEAILEAPLGEFQYSLITGTLTALDKVQAADDFSGTGIRMLSPFAITAGLPAGYIGDPAASTVPVALAGDKIFVVTCPGTVLSYFIYNGLSNSYPVYHLYVDTANATAADRELFATHVTADSSRHSYLSSFAVGEQLDTIRTSLSSISRVGAVANNSSGYYVPYGNGQTDLRGMVIKYPDTWDSPTVAFVEPLYAESVIFHTGYGRGLYLGSTTSRQAMPVLVPGSGTPLDILMLTYDFILDEHSDQAPVPFPMSAGAPVFSEGNRRWVTYDHGGPLAYMFYGMVINPSSDDYYGRAVLQIAGGPTMGEGNLSGSSFTPDGMDGTAIDAFWPLRRVVLPHRNK
jgi:hypothetical protein